MPSKQVTLKPGGKLIALTLYSQTLKCASTDISDVFVPSRKSKIGSEQFCIVSEAKEHVFILYPVFFRVIALSQWRKNTTDSLFYN